MIEIDKDIINRIEVINHYNTNNPVGRLLVLYKELGDFDKIEFSLQDDNKTLKIFLLPKE
jgi:hypothetical protein